MIHYADLRCIFILPDMFLCPSGAPTKTTQGLLFLSNGRFIAVITRNREICLLFFHMNVRASMWILMERDKIILPPEDLW